MESPNERAQELEREAQASKREVEQRVRPPGKSERRQEQRARARRVARPAPVTETEAVTRTETEAPERRVAEQAAGAEAEARAEAEAEAGAATQRVYLVSRGGTRVFFLATAEPWRLEADAFVASVDSWGNVIGGLAIEVLREEQALIRQAVEAGSPDVLRPEAPQLFSVSELSTRASVPARLIAATAFGPGDPGSKPPLPPEPPSARSVATAAEASVHLAAAQGLRRIVVPILESVEELASAEAAEAMLRGVLQALPERGIDEITLTAQSPEALEAMRNLLVQAPQAFSNDLPGGDDRLHIEGEVSALAEALLLRELRPPLVVGVLGGWGSGKSFVMHLMQRRMSEIRSLNMQDQQAWVREAAESEVEAFPYVGHVYLITFDAWTYAKSNLWASLMQTVFFELSRQLALEKQLSEAGVPPLEGGETWKALYFMDPSQRDALLKDQLSREVFEAFQQRARSAVQEPDDFLWQTLRKLKEAEREALLETEKELAKARSGLEEARKQLQLEVDEEIEREARRAAWEPVRDKLIDLLGEGFGTVLERAQAAGAEPGVERVRLTDLSLRPADLPRLAVRNWPEAVAFGAFFTVALATPFVLERAATAQYPSLLVALGSVVGALVRAQERWRRLLGESYADFQRQVAEERARLEFQRSQRVEKRLAEQAERMHEALLSRADPSELTQSVPLLEQEVARLEARAERHRQRVGLTARYVSLSDFVKSRLEEAFYERQLGLMHQVQRDLVELTNSLVMLENDPHAKEKREEFPRGPARVVLFIDDLDRCPPNKVVEVLEATQLLVKTRLFVVVLGMDERFITRALEKAYTGILTRNGSPSGLDYIEKILQIPYRLRPVEPGALGPYLEAQMRVKRAAEIETSAVPIAGEVGAFEAREVEASRIAPADEGLPAVLPTRVLEFSQQEFEFLVACARRIELTPRSLKRLVNVYKLLKIIWYRPTRRARPTWEVEQAVVLLLALTGRYPGLMRGLLEALGIEIERGAEVGLVEFCVAYHPPEGGVQMEQDWQRLLEDVQALAPSEVTLKQVDRPTFELVRSFSFVGDIGHAPEDQAAARRRSRRNGAAE